MLKVQINILEIEQHSSKDKDEPSRKHLEKTKVNLSQELSEAKIQNIVIEDQLNEEVYIEAQAKTQKPEQNL